MANTAVAQSRPNLFHRSGGANLVVPALVLMAVAIVAPLALSFWRSITEPTLGLQHYAGLFTDDITLTVVGRTILTSTIVTAGTVVLGYPYAYLMTRVGATARTLMLSAALVPFWTSMVARNFAWLLLEQRDGPIATMFSWVGIDDLVLYGTTAGVALAMTQVMLPFMVLPLYSNMSSIDRKLLLAGQALGSSPRRAFRKIFLPLSVPGVVSGGILVFALSFGFYVTPAILGSPRQSLVAQLLGQRTLELLDFAGAAALGTAVLLFTLALVTLANRYGGPVSALGHTATQKGE